MKILGMIVASALCSFALANGYVILAVLSFLAVLFIATVKF